MVKDQRERRTKMNADNADRMFPNLGVNSELDQGKGITTLQMLLASLRYLIDRIAIYAVLVRNKRSTLEILRRCYQEKDEGAQGCRLKGVIAAENVFN